MRFITYLSAAMLGLAAVQALAQTPVIDMQGARAGHEPGVGESLPRSGNASNIQPGDTRSTIAPTLTMPSIGADAGPRDYLLSARSALVAGHSGLAQQALEMAETRVLDRSVVASQAGQANDGILVGLIHDALHSLGSGHISESIHTIDMALAI